ncbi:MAG: hypothetical protein IJ137_04040 [Eubacterium sp.]|nr:hypothetical protein [Eubacterium sp.]
MKRYYLRKTAVILLFGMLAMSLTACRSSKNTKSEEETTASTQVKQNNPDYVKKDVVLPEDFGNMIYPMEALMVEEYSKGLPYYTPDASMEVSDSFWYSMAVLTSQMNHYVRDVAVKTDDKYIYIDENTTNMYVAAMYDTFGRGEMEFPERGEDDTYATFDEEQGIYGFRQGSIGSLEPYVTDCRKAGKGYAFSVHLKQKDSVEILASYEITIVPTSFESEENAFAYSVSSFEVTEAADQTSETAEEETTEVTEDTEEETSEEEMTSETSEEETEEQQEETGNNAGQSSISVDDAMNLAKDYFGDEASYSYKETVVIGDYEYYDFSVSGEDIGSTDVLVSVDGENVMGDNRNDDGSWTFDQ